MTYEEKSAIVISQLRADRDRLQDALDKIRAALIKWIDMPGGSYEYDAGLKRALTIIDKYREGKVIEQTELLHRQI